jgi:hypothetical protein
LLVSRSFSNLLGSQGRDREELEEPVSCAEGRAMATLIARSIDNLTLSTPGSKETDLPGKGSGHNLPSWEALANRLEASPAIRSESLSKAKLRLFGDDKEPRLTFYRDDSAWCPFCETVWICLEEKKISYAVKKIHLKAYGKKPDWYFQIAPSGLVPALDIDGVIATESADLLFLLEEKFPDHKALLPAEGSAERKALNDLVKLQQEWIGVWRGIFLNGWIGADTQLEAVLTKIDTELQRFGGPFFFGKEVCYIPPLKWPQAPFMFDVLCSFA